MALGSNSLGSIGFGGLAGESATIVTPSPQALALTLQTPTIITVDGTIVFPATQTLALTLHAPNLLVTPQVAATLDAGLTVQAPTILIVHQVAAPQSLALAFGGTHVPDVSPEPGTLSLGLVGLDVLIPTIVIKKLMGPDLRLRVASPNTLDKIQGYLNVTIVKYISDPLVVGGCPQCGTFLYPKKGRDMPTQLVSIGRNFENAKDDTFIQCGRCGWHVKRSRHPAMPDRSRAGWGINYTEIEVP